MSNDDKRFLELVASVNQLTAIMDILLERIEKLEKEQVTVAHFLHAQRLKVEHVNKILRDE